MVKDDIDMALIIVMTDVIMNENYVLLMMTIYVIVERCIRYSLPIRIMRDCYFASFLVEVFFIGLFKQKHLK